MKVPITREVLAQFWPSVEDMTNKKGEDCWLWIGNSNTTGGYGRITIKLRKSKYITIKAHRFSYLMFVGTLLRNLNICHSCDNPLCVNPFHLEQKTNKENMEDCSKRNRIFNSNKTKCWAGHKYTEENTYIDSKGFRRCRTCMKKRRKEVYSLGLG